MEQQLKSAMNLKENGSVDGRVYRKETEEWVM